MTPACQASCRAGSSSAWRWPARLVLEPQVLLFDEPLSNLDAKLRRQMRQDIRGIQQDLGLTVVYVAHDQEEALAVSDRIIVMRNAGIAQDGTPRALYEAPVDRFVADFIGEANLIPCQIVSVRDGQAKITVGTLNHTLDARGLGAGPAVVAVRLGRVSLSESVNDGRLAARITKSTYVGNHMEYTVDVEFGTVFAESEDVGAPFEVGQEVGLGFTRTGPVLLLENEP